MIFILYWQNVQFLRNIYIYSCSLAVIFDHFSPFESQDLIYKSKKNSKIELN